MGHICGSLHTLAVSTINVEEKQLVQQDGIITKCDWYRPKIQEHASFLISQQLV